MKQIVTTLFFGALLAASTQAQTYSTPMRDVDEPARNAVQANCVLDWQAPPVGVKQCVAYTVPAGKRLAIRMVTANCVVQTGDKINFVEVYTQLGQTQSALLPAAKISNVNGVDIVGALSPVFLHAEAGSQVKFRASYSAVAQISAVCQVGLHGYLVPQN